MQTRPRSNRSPHAVLRPFTLLFYIGIAVALSGGLLHRFYSVPEIWALVGAAMMLASCAVVCKELICVLIDARRRDSE